MFTQAPLACDRTFRKRASERAEWGEISRASGDTAPSVTNAPITRSNGNDDRKSGKNQPFMYLWAQSRGQGGGQEERQVEGKWETEEEGLPKGLHGPAQRPTLNPGFDPRF